MNREDIIRMAREAGFEQAGHLSFQEITHRLENFAALVASAEREVSEHKFMRLQSLMDIRETQPNKPCCLAEREACANLLEQAAEAAKNTDPQGFVWRAVKESAEAIRAREQA